MLENVLFQDVLLETNYIFSCLPSEMSEPVNHISQPNKMSS